MSRTNAIVNYHYDALDRIISTEHAGLPDTRRFYHDGRLDSEVQDSQQHQLFRHGQQVFGQSTISARQTQNLLLATDQAGSVFQSHAVDQRQDHTYTPYGDRPADSGGLHSLLGFNAERPDPITGCYLLGGGYRAYNPVLMRFHSPDNMSPFGMGGVNPYAYCVGDPINLSDPTGHFSLKSLFKVVVSVFAIALAVATLTFGAPVTGLVAVGAIIDIAATSLGIAAVFATELAPESRAGSVLDQFSIGLGIVAFSAISFAGKGGLGGRVGGAIGKFFRRDGQNRVGGVLSTLTRQGAVRVSNGQALRSLSGVANLGAAARNTVAWDDRLQLLKTGIDYLKYAGYVWSAADVIKDYAAGPKDNDASGTPDNSQTGTEASNRDIGDLFSPSSGFYFSAEDQVGRIRG